MIDVFRKLAMALALSLCAVVAHADEGDDAFRKLPWQDGPIKVDVGTNATLEVPKGYSFLGPDGTRKLEELLHNPPDDEPTYTFAPSDGAWLAYFAYDDTGYVKDDEKIDADALLQSFKDGTEEANEERRKRGWEAIHVVGWKASPVYDTQFKTLAWSILGREDGSKEDIVNYNTRLLGRTGVMRVLLVAGSEDLDAAVADFKQKADGFAFKPGQTYADFRSGDRVAEYGLGALIVGGAAAVAAKKGVFAVIGKFFLVAWKFILIGLAAVGGFVRRLFGRRGS